MFSQMALITMAVWTIMSMSIFLMIPSILTFTSISMYMKWIYTSNPWVSLIFVLAFLGGLMIIFMYVISTLNKKMNKNKSSKLLMSTIFFLMTWEMKWGSSCTFTLTMLSSFSGYYFILCFLILLILVLTTKVINSPFKPMKSAF